MGRISVDFSDIQEFSPLEKGEYSGTITGAVLVEASSEDKYDYINLEITLDEEGFEGRKAWVIWSLSPKALFRMKQDMESLGILPEDEEFEIEVDEDTDPPIILEPPLVDLPVIVVADKPRTYEGRAQNNIAMLRSPDDGRAGEKKVAGAKKTTAAGGKKKFK